MYPFLHPVKYLFQITSLHFYPGRQNVLISTGKGHVNVWTLTKKKDGNEGETELNKKQGLFTRKIDRPSSVTCAAFAKGNAEFLTGDSEGNVMVWKGIRVVRVLKGAHQGIVGDICVIEEVSLFFNVIEIRFYFIYPFCYNRKIIKYVCLSH